MVERGSKRLNERVWAVLGDEVENPALTDAHGGDPGPHVSAQEFGQPAVGEEYLEYRADQCSPLEETNRRQAEALLEDLACVGGDGPGRHAADVVPVRDVRRPRNQLGLGEHGQCEHDIVQVSDAAERRVVGDKDVAGRDFGGMQLEDPLHRLVEHADEGRDSGAGGGEIAVAIGDAGPHVEHLVDDRAHCRLAQRCDHLLARRPDRALDDLERDRIGREHAYVSTPYTARALSSVT